MSKRTVSRGRGWEIYEISNYGTASIAEMADFADCNNFGYAVLSKSADHITIKIYTD